MVKSDRQREDRPASDWMFANMARKAAHARRQPMGWGKIQELIAHSDRERFRIIAAAQGNFR